MNINELIGQLGGRGLSGALVYTGTSEVVNNESSARFKVNGRRGYATYIIVTLEPSDTYLLSLVAVRGTEFVTHAELDQVYCDEIQDVFESMYDQHMQTVGGGFIPLDKGGRR